VLHLYWKLLLKSVILFFFQAEERVKDKLAAAAREKIAAAAREKQLQLERKRRAAAFLNMIRKDHPLGTLDSPIIGNLTLP
jgi:hypothetical protein